MFYVSTLLLYNTLQAATPLVDTVLYDRSSVRVATMRSLSAKSYYDVIVNNKIHQ